MLSLTEIWGEDTGSSSETWSRADASLLLPVSSWAPEPSELHIRSCSF